MRTNIDIDDGLLQEAMALSSVNTKKELIHEALQTYINLKRRKDLTELAGRVELSKDFDHKKMRELRE
mgnify:FL=1